MSSVSFVSKESRPLLSGRQTESFQVKKQSGFALAAVKAEHLVGFLATKVCPSSSLLSDMSRSGCFQ